MYINLGNTNLNYSTSLDDYIIVSEVVDSQLSYENPVLVRTKDELDIWFGRDFSDRNYFDELLQRGVTLYLYKPILSSNIRDRNYVDLGSYVNVLYVLNFYDHIENIINPSSNIIYNIKDIKWKYTDENGFELYIEGDEYINEIRTIYSSPEEITNPEDDTIYHISSKMYYDNGEWKDYKNEEGYSEDIKINGFISIEEIEDIYDHNPEEYINKIFCLKNGEKYIYDVDTDSWINVDLLPQNIDNISSSLDNRDTLFIDGFGNTCHPEFSYSDFNLGIYTEDLNYDELTYEDNYSDFNNEQETIAFRIKKIDSTNTLSSGYIVIQNINPENEHEGYLCRSTDDINELEVNDYCYNDWKNEEKITNFSDLISKYSELGYSYKEINNYEYLIYSEGAYITKLTYFYTFDDIEIENEFQINNNILYYNYNQTHQYPVSVIKFWSKSIGFCDEHIKVKIENIKEDITRITLSRYDYYEVFEGPLYPDENEERIDNLITKYSKLVYCEFIPKMLNQVYTLQSQGTYVECEDFRLDFDEEIQGTVKIKTKRIDRKHYSLTVNNTDQVYILKISDLTGFCLIEGVFELMGGVKEVNGSFDKGLDCMFDINKTNVYPDFILVPDKHKYSGDSIFLPIAEEYNLQVLLENNETDFTENLIDKNNRLIYFYKSMQINLRKRPGYYLHLLGVLGNIFSMSSEYIIYETPGKEYEEPELELEKYKSNYLIFNNHQYFYKKYFSGEDYDCTVWMRFVLGKIERELNKHKGYFLTQRHMGRVRNTLERLLGKIEARFSIVKSISLIKFIPELNKNYLSIGIKTEINDLVDKDVTINLTINI